MIDPLREQLLDLREAAEWLPRKHGTKPVHVSTLYRWSSKGSKGVRLETVRVGGRTCTSLEALSRFIQESSGERDASRKEMR